MIMSSGLATRVASRGRRLAVSAFIATTLAGTAAWPRTAAADEGGVSFWLPGLFGSLAALPVQPGFSMASIYYHTSVGAGGSRTFTRGGQLIASVDGDANLFLLVPSYAFATPVLGGQFALSMTSVVGRNKVGADAVIVGPMGNVIAGSIRDSVTGFGDLYPTATLKWNRGVHNFMTYVTGGIPVGAYSPNRIANIGIGHAAIDGGVGYTYFDPTKGHEFSVVTGLTYNFTNPDTQYQNGVDFHVDWGASQFLSKQLLVGVVGYAFQQLSCDSGAGARLGCFKSRVFGIGPQVGYIIPMGEWQGYLNLKGYGEFGEQNRPAGWNVWLTFSISPAAAPRPPAHTALVHK